MLSIPSERRITDESVIKCSMLVLLRCRIGFVFRNQYRSSERNAWKVWSKVQYLGSLFTITFILRCSSEHDNRSTRGQLSISLAKNFFDFFRASAREPVARKERQTTSRALLWQDSLDAKETCFLRTSTPWSVNRDPDDCNSLLSVRVEQLSLSVLGVRSRSWRKRVLRFLISERSLSALSRCSEVCTLTGGGRCSPACAVSAGRAGLERLRASTSGCSGESGASCTRLVESCEEQDDTAPL
eukprot:Gregarina_sp_Pseudo_9__250@NODE_115_length_4185_cov_38_836469_g107_i0_p4_GENE_NODE_115_length_4185_cov_38_836469_g107_i0NODE_115_length_4185_cov_38_836469_g107_i0_p4_ORF_typecomplete_len242_score7_32DUF2776/PF10951_8/0_044_NODE_115_length_4185_cov_38_836469_g107_i03981123